MAKFLGFFGRAAGEGAAFAFGVTAAPTLRPAVEELTHAAWRVHASRALSVGDLASGVASGEIDRDWARDEARNTGYNTARFDRLVQVMDEGPGVAQAFRLWRRGEINDGAFRRALKRAKIEDEWIDALVKTKHEPLDPAVIANAVQQGFIDAGDLLPTDAGAAPFTPPVEQVPLDAVTQAEMSGVAKDHLRVLAQLSGNPPGPMQLLDLWNRRVITETAVDHGIREGRTKTKWTEPLKALRWNVLTGVQVVNARLRGWIQDDEMYRRGEAAGYQKDELDLLFKTQGRPLTWHQTWIGLQRGGTYDGPIDDIHPAFLTSLRQSNIRPEWYNLAWHSRYSYPTAFVLRSLTQDGTLTAAQAEADLLDMGWRPDRAKQVAETWAGGSTTEAGGAYVDKAKTQLWTTTHAAYRNGLANKGDARTAFVAIGVPVAERDAVLAAWDAERALYRKTLTPAQIKKAWVKATKNQTTGQAWTRDDALSALRDLGYSVNDANEFLDIPPTQAAPVKALTASQIRQAFQEGDVNPATGAAWTSDEAVAALVALGYSVADATVYLGLGA